MANAFNADIMSVAAAIAGKSIVDSIRVLSALFPGKITFSSSFSAEDQVLAHLIAINQLDVSIFTLDTGRLFHQTYATWTNTLERYGVHINAFFPDTNAVENYVAVNGPNGFYSSIENRKECCRIRKVLPLKRALDGKKVWITGIRAKHSPERNDLPVLEWDSNNNILKYNPLLSWTNDEVWQYIHQHNIPFNILHQQGFVSIGCEPCTRAIKEGESFRAGRWWWEDTSKKECGLHIHK